MNVRPTYLLDTNVVSEIRKQSRDNPGVQAFFKTAFSQKAKLYLSVITVGEIRYGIQRLRHRGDTPQAEQLEAWLNLILDEYADFILNFAMTEAQVWGCLRVPNPQNAIDKQLAATGLSI